MLVKTLVLGMFQTNCYIVGKEGTCVVIDPADNGNKINKTIEELEMKPVAIFLTHSHFDHILAVPEIRSKWGDIPVYCNERDWSDEKTEVFMGGSYPTVTSFGNVINYDEGDIIDVGEFKVKVMHTPGHTEGSVILEIEDMLFTGDTLFRGSIGRVDFKGGDSKKMNASLKRLVALPKDYRIMPGHDAASTLYTEKKTNPYLV
ncbi:hypothetical protein AN639_04500 [Candidatus Epulonipiscium fishelsonii]|uniref:Uncharacterized protein n=1 Tax=Candidatus Epulonipiscium fishelsonii TaxID=77094 RepID=A0ACC8X8E7_9FIRM|nr:hypothetical protein AN396_11190 [Epulopiscium sp. SCG-B11WGA-EpuloA1]ONI40554.1 hypothetical protein AN639_04500 [Epulopiscium sp. SCG-B05WGA-EpuloA1]